MKSIVCSFAVLLCTICTFAQVESEVDFYPRLNTDGYFVLSCTDTQKYHHVELTEHYPDKYLCYSKEHGIQLVSARKKVQLTKLGNQVSFEKILKLYVAHSIDSAWIYDSEGTFLETSLFDDYIFPVYDGVVYLRYQDQHWQAVEKNLHYDVPLERYEHPFRIDGNALHTVIESDTFVRFFSEKCSTKIPRTKNWRYTDVGLTMYDSTTGYISLYQNSKEKIATKFDFVSQKNQNFTVGNVGTNAVVEYQKGAEHVFGPYIVESSSDSLLVVNDTLRNVGWLSDIYGNVKTKQAYSSCGFNHFRYGEFILSCYTKESRFTYVGNVFTNEGKIITFHNLAGESTQTVTFHYIESLISNEFIGLTSKYQKEKVLYRLKGTDAYQVPPCK